MYITKSNVLINKTPTSVQNGENLNFDPASVTDPDFSTFYVSTDNNRLTFDFGAVSNINYVAYAGLNIEGARNFTSRVRVRDGSTIITVQTRGTNIVYTNTLTRTTSDTHDPLDEVFVCEVSDNERIDDLLERILLDIGTDSSFIPKAKWTAEVDEWHPSTRVNTIWIESKPTSDVLKEILTNYMLDMWFYPVDREIKLSAISVWKESSISITEGNEIDFESVTKKRNETLRSTRALVVYNKPYLTNPDEVTSFSKSSIFKNTTLESDDLFGEVKTKSFDFTAVIDKDSADLLVNRWVSRFSNPQDYIFKAQERKLNFKVGDIVDISTFFRRWF
jgi:hypothetical protein